jgi:nitronate monooxygenase
VRYALEQGAAGVQVDTAFAFSRESGLRPDLKQSLIAQAVTGTAEVFTDPLASPTGFPFKVALLQGSYSDPEVAAARTRVCDIGLLRESYATPDGKIGYRCSAEPVANYVAKGGKVEDTVGRKCLCNALLANIGHAQVRRDQSVEPPLITVGDDLNTVAQFLAPGRTSYGAADVVASLLSLTADAAAAEQEEEPVFATA